MALFYFHERDKKYKTNLFGFLGKLQIYLNILIKIFKISGGVNGWMLTTSDSTNNLLIISKLSIWGHGFNLIKKSLEI